MLGLFSCLLSGSANAFAALGIVHKHGLKLAHQASDRLLWREVLIDPALELVLQTCHFYTFLANLSCMLKEFTGLI